MNSVKIKAERELFVKDAFHIRGSKTFPDIVEGVVAICGLLETGLKSEDYKEDSNFDSDIYGKVESFINTEVGYAENKQEAQAIREDLENQPWVIYAYEKDGFSSLFVLPICEFLNHTSNYF